MCGDERCECDPVASNALNQGEEEKASPEGATSTPNQEDKLNQGQGVLGSEGERPSLYLELVFRAYHDRTAS